MAAKLTPEQQAIDRELYRINRQIVQAYKVFGQSGRLAQQYETLLYTSGKGRGKSDKTAPASYQTLVRKNKAGIPQLARSKAAIRLVQSGGAANAIMQLGRMQTVAQAKKASIAAYEKRTGQKAKTAKDKQAAFEAEKKRYTEMQGALGKALTEMYKIERERGVKFKNHDEIKNLSKGSWTSDKDLEKMIELAQDTVSNEAAAVVSEFDVLQGY